MRLVVRHPSSLARWSRPWRLALLLLALPPLLPLPAGAQERRPGPRAGAPPVAAEPSNWVSLSTGFEIAPLVQDGATSANWDFGTGFPIRMSVEHALGGSFSAGVAASYVRMPLVYSSATAACPSCNAHATIATYGAVAHSSGTSRGFGQVFELFLGAVQYGNFERDSPRVQLPPTKANLDFLFSVGYGFGYAFAPDWRVEIVQEYANAIHERGSLPGNAQTLSRTYVTRLALRVGL